MSMVSTRALRVIQAVEPGRGSSRYVVVGAGAVGATVAARLAEVGCNVVLVARGRGGDVIRQNGLRVGLPDHEIAIRIPVVTTISSLTLSESDVVILAVKSQDSIDPLRELAACSIGANRAGDVLPIFCFQNGVENERTAGRFFQHVHGVSVALPAERLSPGVIVAHGSPVSGVLELGRFPIGVDSHDVAMSAVLNEAGFDALARRDVMAWKRTKLLGNLVHALEPIVGFGLARGEAEVAERIGDAAQAEAMACFQAAGLSMIDRDERDERIRGRMRVFPVNGRERSGNSTWQSVASGRVTTETDYLNGEIVRLGRILGIPTPMNRALQRCMTEITHGGRAVGLTLPSQLISLADVESDLGASPDLL